MTATFRGLALAILIGAAASAAGAAGATDAANVAARTGQPRRLAFSVTRETDETGGRWLALRVEYETSIGAGIEEILAVLEDYEGSPSVFSRIESVKVRSRDGPSRAVTEQVSGVRVLGLAFMSRMAFECQVERPAAGRARQSFKAIETDGGTKSCEGSWSLEEAGPGLTRVLYRLDTWAEPRFPMQEAIMRSFGPGDIERTLRELGAAVERRRREAARGATSRP